MSNRIYMIQQFYVVISAYKGSPSYVQIMIEVCYS